MSAHGSSWRTNPRLLPRGNQLSDAELALIERDAAISFRQAGATPALMSLTKAEGIWIEDASGNRYRDFYGNNCHHVGYGHPRVVAAMREQLQRIAFVSRGLTSEASIALGEKLVEHYPYRGARVLLAPGGAAAVEIALMIAKANTGRYKTVSFWDSYHGRSAGALSVGGTPRDKSPKLGPLMPGALHVPPFYWAARGRHPTDADRAASARASLDAIRIVLESERDIAALIAEPIRNGPYFPAPGYWAEVRTLCDRHGTLLIFDEIPTGLGKTGRLFNSEHFGVKPDMTLLGKALGGAAAPLAAVIADGALDTTSDLNLSYFTHEKNPLSAAAGLATLSLIVEERLPERAMRLGGGIDAWLKGLTHLPIVADTRCAGLMFAIDFDGASLGRSDEQLAGEAMAALMRQGILAMPPKGRTLSFSLPLTIEDSEVALSLRLIGETMAGLASRA